MALSDEDFNIEDEEDYEASDTDIENNTTIDSDNSNGTTQSEIGSDDTTQSDSALYDESASDESIHSQSNTEEKQPNEEQERRLLKQTQMANAQKDLQNIHKKLRQIIEDKLKTKKWYINKSKKYRDKAKIADDEYLAVCYADMDESEGMIDVLTEQPSLINMEKGVLRSYQLDGLNWLIRVQETGLAAILADEMGLGKTLQCIALLAYNKEYKSIAGPTLIVVPKSTLYIWQKEFASWCPSLRIFLLDGNKSERKALIEEYILSVLNESNLDFDVAITSYEQCNIEAQYLQRIDWFYIVVDEAHRMKNEKAVLSQTIRSFKSQHRLLITGTPLQNNLHELWALLNFLIPEAFMDAHSFDILFEAQQQHTNAQVLDEELLTLINNMLREMHKLLRPLMLRRLKYDVEKSLPPKTEMILYVGMSSLQIALYKSFLSRNMAVLRNTISSKKALLNTVMQLRKVCNHPYLFEGVEDRSLPVHGLHVIDHSAKLCMLNKLLPKLLEQDSKCLIFCQMTRMLDILDDYCYIKGYQRCRIDGNTLGRDRQSQMDDFNDPQSDKFIFLLSTRAGGLGINLVAADCVVFYDSDWNPQMDLQAQDRAHRIGQTKAVKIFRLVSKNTIEEKILERAQCKLHLDELVIQQAAKTAATATAKPVSKGEVAAMIKHGIDEIVKIQDGDSTLKEMNELSIEQILSEGKQASAKLNELMTKHARNKFSIKSTDYSLLEDCTLDGDVFRTLEKLKKQQLPGTTRKNVPKKGGRTTNNSSNGYIKIENGFDFEAKIKAINRAQDHHHKQKVNNLEVPRKPPQMQYFHFFEKEILSALFDKQWSWYNTYKNVEQDEIPQLNYDRYGLTEEEYALKEQLFADGFPDWNHKHMWAFVKSCTEFGRENIDEICEAMMRMKPKQEIIRYSQCFFANKRNDKEITKKIKDITDGERTLERYGKYDMLLKKKVSKYKYPMQEMIFKNAPYDNRAHGWRIEHDRFIVCKATEIGYGHWKELRLAVMNSKLFTFDYFIRSRTNNDINKRMRQLRPCIEKEFGQHIRIFDRKKSAKELQKQKEHEQNRLNKYLKGLSKALKEEKERGKKKMKKENQVNMKRDRDDRSDSDTEEEEEEEEPPHKKRKVDELPTPPPVTTMEQAYISRSAVSIFPQHKLHNTEEEGFQQQNSYQIPFQAQNNNYQP